ncbi:MAG: sulfatase [Roseibacillus sp.]
MKTLLLASLLFPLLACAETSQPNIVLFFVDDMGWDDMGYRDKLYETPHLDQLAQESVDFQQAYIPCPTCSPSRGALVTGQHPARLKLVRHIPNDPENGFDEFGRSEKKFNLWPTDPAQFPCVNWLSLDHPTYAEELGKLGYYNLFVGKWHLGHEPYHPVKQGFDRQIGTSNFGHPKSYYPPYFKNGPVFADEKERYLTDKLTDETVSFIADYEKEKPFMISLWYYTVHGPHVGRKDLIQRFKDKGMEKKEATYAAMCTAMDESVGRVRKALSEKGIADDTVIIFLSDQGAMFENKPFRGGKRSETLYEGGARVPFMISWPGVTKAGPNRQVVESTDLFPTLLEIAGGDPSGVKNLNGVSLLPALKNGAIVERTNPIIGYRAYEDLYASVRDGDWKLLAYRSGTIKLYNLAQDISETTDLSEKETEITTRLVETLKAWEKEMQVEQYSGVQS